MSTKVGLSLASIHRKAALARKATAEKAGAELREASRLARLERFRPLIAKYELWANEKKEPESQNSYLLTA